MKADINPRAVFINRSHVPSVAGFLTCFLEVVRRRWDIGVNTEGTGLARKHRKPEEIVAKLRQVEVLVGQGKPVAEGVRAIGVRRPTTAGVRSMAV